MWPQLTGPAVLLVLGITALLLLPVAIWCRANSEEIVVWALEQEIASESATRWLPGFIRTTSLLAAVTLAVAALPAYVAGVMLARRVPIVRYLTDAAWQGVRPVIRVGAAMSAVVLEMVVAIGRPVVITALIAGRLATTAFRLVLEAIHSLIVLLAVAVYIAGTGTARCARVVLTLAMSELSRPVVLVTRGITAGSSAVARMIHLLVGRLNTMLARIALSLRIFIVDPLKAVTALVLSAIEIALATIMKAGGNLVAGTQRYIGLMLAALERGRQITLTFLRRRLVEPILVASSSVLRRLRATSLAVFALLGRLTATTASIIAAGARLVGGWLTLLLRALLLPVRILADWLPAAFSMATLIATTLVRWVRQVLSGLGSRLHRLVRLLGEAGAAMLRALRQTATVALAPLVRIWSRILVTMRAALSKTVRYLLFALSAVLTPIRALLRLAGQGIAIGLLVTGAAFALGGRAIERSAAVVGRRVAVVVAALAAMAVLLSRIFYVVVLPLRFTARALEFMNGLVGKIGGYCRALLAAFVDGLAQSLAAAGRGGWAVTCAVARPLASVAGAYGQGMAGAGFIVVRWPWGKIVSVAMVAAAIGGVALGAYLARPEAQVTVVHWSTGHLIRDGSGLRLLRQMADEFNSMGYRPESGKPIRIDVRYMGGADQAAELTSRLTNGGRLDKTLPDPTLVTPSASHWMINVNYAAGAEIVDLSNTDARSLARTYVGIVTYEEMAKCLGWPDTPIGYADLLALRSNPGGWANYSCANPDWGQRPLIAFTDPSLSDTGRTVLMSLYMLGSGKAPEALTEDDLKDPAVVDYVRSFQSLVDHYMPTTLALNTRVCEGPRYGHFFIMPEDNLAHLLDGTEKCIINGIEQDAPPLKHKLVFIYPEEGTLLRENCACAVKAPWVDAEEAAATELWVRFLLEERQQASFQAAGFHQGNPVSSSSRTSRLEASSPSTAILHPERIAPAVAKAIDSSWHLVKRPAIVTFVADTSGSMLGDKLRNEQSGLIEAFNQMATNNQVGLVTFGDSAKRVVELAPVTSNKAELVRAVERLRAEGETALYDAIREGIVMTDAASGDPDAIRAVVVITDGRANRGSTCLHDIVAMTSLSERPVEAFCGMENDEAREQGGRYLVRSEVAGTSLSIPTQHDIQVFYVAIGKDADLDIGRILSGATGAEFRGATQADLSELILEFSHYF